MDDAPPPYDGSGSGGYYSKNSGDPKQGLSFADRLATSRSQHIAATVPIIQSLIEDRARYGIAKMTCVLIPKGQCDLSRKHEIVEFVQSKKLIIIELAGEMDGVDFWEQPQALHELESQLWSSLTGQSGRGHSRVGLSIRRGGVHVRSESPYGLYETTSVKTVLVEVET